ncbi:hypothetical protein C8R44DRAFT_629569, partial [Mycena epipterygia]
MGAREGQRKSVPFIQTVLLQKDGGEVVEEDAVVDDGAMANAIDTDTYEAARQQLGELAWTSRVLRMANGELVPSRGFWSGDVCLGGEWRPGRFEVFPSGGAWAMLFGKPLLESFAAWHGYEEDVILLRGANGNTV